MQGEISNDVKNRKEIRIKKGQKLWQKEEKCLKHFNRKSFYNR